MLWWQRGSRRLIHKEHLRLKSRGELGKQAVSRRKGSLTSNALTPWKDCSRTRRKRKKKILFFVQGARYTQCVLCNLDVVDVYNSSRHNILFASASRIKLTGHINSYWKFRLFVLCHKHCNDANLCKRFACQFTCPVNDRSQLIIGLLKYRLLEISVQSPYGCNNATTSGNTSNAVICCDQWRRCNKSRKITMVEVNKPWPRPVLHANVSSPTRFNEVNGNGRSITVRDFSLSFQLCQTSKNRKRMF